MLLLVLLRLLPVLELYWSSVPPCLVQPTIANAAIKNTSFFISPLL